MRLLASVALIALATPAIAQKDQMPGNREAINRIIDEGLNHSRVMRTKPIPTDPFEYPDDEDN